MLALVCRVPLNEGPTCDGEEYTFLDGLLYHYLQWRSASPTVVHLTSLISKLLDSGGEITKLPETSFCVSNRLELSTPVACLLLPRVVNELCLQGMNYDLLHYFSLNPCSPRQTLDFPTLKLLS